MFIGSVSARYKNRRLDIIFQFKGICVRGIKVWVEAARPKTLWAAVAPVLIGTAMAFADGKWDPLIAIVTLLSAMMIQVGTNFANDYYDYKKGADTD